MVAGMDRLRTEMNRRRSTLFGLATIVALVSCDRSAVDRDGGAVASSADTATTRGVVDSALPPGEALHRFRSGLDSPRTMSGPRTRDQLFHAFVTGFRRKDRGALEQLALTRAEFAFLVFPELRISRPPYNQPPDVEWMLSQAASGGGLTKLLNRADQLELQSYECPSKPEREGPLTLWRQCLIRVRDAGEVRQLQLFGTIVERDGRFKFSGFRNDF